jgi:thymidylate synthase ThyX
MTELIFSANLAQWKRMILMRASNYADAEIRLLFNDIFDALREKYPDRFENWKKTTANDSMGFDVGK